MANIVEYILKISSKDATDGLQKVSRSAKQAERQLDETNKSASNLGKSLLTSGSRIAAGLGVAVAGAGALLVAINKLTEASYDLTKSVVDSVNNLNDLSARSGIAASSIQAIQTAFVASGQEASKAETFISRFPKLYADLAIEGSRASEAAKQLGVSVQNSDGSLKSSDQLMKEVISTLQQIPDDTQRATTAFLLFGRGAGEVLQAFGKTADFEAFVNITEKFGVSTGPEATKAASEFQIQLAILRNVIDGLKQRFVNAVGGVNFFNSAIRRSIIFVVGLQEFIAKNIDIFAAFGESLAGIAVGFFSFLQSTFSEFASVVNFSTKIISGNLYTIATALHAVGAISDQTYASIAQIGINLEKLGSTTVKLGSKLENYKPTQSSSATAIIADLDTILAGLDEQAKNTGLDFDELGKSVDDAGKSAKQATEEFKRTAEEQKFDKTLSTFDSLIARTAESFDQLGKTDEQLKLEGLDRLIADLEKASEFYTEEGFAKDALKAEQLIANARAQQTEIILSNVEALRTAGDTIESFFGSVQNSVNALTSPEAFIRSIPSALERAPQIASFVGAGSQLSSAAASASAAAPVVGAIAGLVAALSKLGESTTQEIDEKFDSFVQNFEKGINILPDILKRVLPEFIVQISKILLVDLTRLIAFDLPLAIVQALPQLIAELIQELVLLIADIFKGVVRTVEGITSFIDQLKSEGIKGLFDAFTKAINDQLLRNKEFIDEAFSMRSGGRYIPSARGGIRFTGSEEGLAMLHRGEFVVPESNVAPQAVQQRLDRSLGAGMNITINADIVEGSAVDALVRKIEERFGSFGASTSNLFGGL